MDNNPRRYKPRDVVALEANLCQILHDHGLSIPEIADALSISRTDASNRLYRWKPTKRGAAL